MKDGDVWGFSLLPVSKTNLAVHEDKNRVPHVKVSPLLLLSHDHQDLIVTCFSGTFLSGVHRALRVPSRGGDGRHR